MQVEPQNGLEEVPEPHNRPTTGLPELKKVTIEESSEKQVQIVFDCENKLMYLNIMNQVSGELRRIAVPAHRYTPLKENWQKILSPVVEHLQLQIRFNTRTRMVELRVSIIYHNDHEHDIKIKLTNRILRLPRT